MRFTYTPAQLKRRRLLIRAGIAIVTRSVDKGVLMKQCLAKCRKLPGGRKMFTGWYADHWKLARDEFLAELRRKAKELGLHNWRLRHVK